jgi:hypothetical protein
MNRPFFGDYSRRDFLNISLASAFGVSYSGWLGSLARANIATRPRSCIVLWMPGGPSQLDTFDPKPGHENGGPYQAIETAVPGIKISEHLPGLAKHMKDMAIVRSMTSKEGDHQQATHMLLTGYREQEAVRYPELGSIISKELGKADNELPNYVSVSPFRFSNAGAGFLGPQYAPLVVTGDSDNPQARANMSVENLLPPNGDVKSLQGRFELLDFVQTEFNKKYKSESSTAHRANYERAVRMVKSQARSAFKLEDEPAALRDAYGRNRFGQGCLLARRLVERDVPFVEVTLTGTPANWDTHGNNFESVKQLSGVLDPAWATRKTEVKSYAEAPPVAKPSAGELLWKQKCAAAGTRMRVVPAASSREWRRAATNSAAVPHCHGFSREAELGNRRHVYRHRSDSQRLGLDHAFARNPKASRDHLIRRR